MVGQKRADPDERGVYRNFSIHLAAIFARKDLVQYLVGINANILIKDSDGNNVLHYALFHSSNCEIHHPETEQILKIFLKKNAALVYGKNIWKMTPLHLAAESDF